MRHFKKGVIPELKYRKAVKKPIPVRCIRMDEAFTVETLEGTLEGKPGDWLMVGVRGEMYPIDHEIFLETYSLMPEGPDNGSG